MADQEYTEEIDLSYLWRKFTAFIKKCIIAAFMVLAFFKKYWLVTLVLLLVGIGYGYYKDQTRAVSFKNEGIVIPNFESVDYLYSNIEEFNNRIKSNDTTFLKSVLGKNFKAIREIEIEPIPDIYNMMTKSREQIDVFRILFQNQEFDKFTENIATGKYFKFHKITFTVKGKGTSKAAIKSIQSFWNSNEHFSEYGEIYKENAVFQVKEYKHMIAQVDSIIHSITNETARSQNTGVVISDNTNLHALLDRKKEMLEELLQAEVRVSDYTEPVKIVYMDYEVEVGYLSKSIKYPIYLIALFGFIFFIGFVYKKMKEIAES